MENPYLQNNHIWYILDGYLVSGTKIMKRKEFMKICSRNIVLHFEFGTQGVILALDVWF